MLERGEGRVHSEAGSFARSRRPVRLRVARAPQTECGLRKHAPQRGGTGGIKAGRILTAPFFGRPLDNSTTIRNTIRMNTFADFLDRELAAAITSKGPAGIDLFSGAGGLTIGLKAAGVRTVAAVEFESYRIATYLEHSPGTTVLASDVRAVDFSIFRGKVDLVYGGPPCQPFSSGGLRRATSDDRNMIPEFLRAVEEIEPAAVLMENVPGLLAADRRQYFETVLDELRDLGFEVTKKVLNAADFGVPQKRRRLFVVGLRDKKFSFPGETHGPGLANPHLAVRDALPGEMMGERNPSKVFYAKNPDLRPSPFDGHVFNGGGRAIDPSKPCHTILASAGGNKTHFFDTLGLVPAYHRHLARGGEPRSGILKGGRRLTVEESALIQSFPSWVTFHGPRSAQYHQVGDAVPPLLARALAKTLVEQMTQRPSTRRAKTRLPSKTLFG